MSGMQTSESSVSVSVGDLLDRYSRRGFEGYEEYVEVDRYWVLRPYSYISILYNEEDKDYIYYVVEPELDEHESVLLQEVSERLKDRIQTEEVTEDARSVTSTFRNQEDILMEKAMNVVKEYGVRADSETFHKVLYYMERDFIRYGEIEPIIQDPRVEDISCNGEGIPVHIMHQKYENMKTNVVFEREALDRFVKELAQRSGKHISAADPLVNASLPDGSRANLVLGRDISSHGSNFTIRRFPDEPLTPIHLVKYGTFSLEQMSYLWMAIENDKSLIFAGGTGSGKTTSMNAVSMFIPPRDKIVSIEDTKEVTLPHENWTSLMTRGSFGAVESHSQDDSSTMSEINMYNLLRNALRMRPEYLLVGEVRGQEAETLFQAMSTGHTTYSTVHADTVEDVFRRFRNDPIGVPDPMLESLDIVSVQEEITIEGETERRNRVIAEVQDVDEDRGGVGYTEYFTYDPETDVHNEVTARSVVMDSITTENGWTRERTQNERKKRERVLEYMLENDITGYEEVTRIVQAFMVDQDAVLDGIEAGTLKPKQFESMQSVV